MSQDKTSGLWTLKASLKKGSWQTPWADHGLTNTTTDKIGTPVTLPIVVTVGDDLVFTKDCSLSYRAALNKSGTAK